MREVFANEMSEGLEDAKRLPVVSKPMVCEPLQTEGLSVDEYRRRPEWAVRNERSE